MSRVAKAPVTYPTNVDVQLDAGQITVKGPKGTLTQKINKLVMMNTSSDPRQIEFSPAANDPNAWAQAGTARALVRNMVQGVTEGFVVTLELIGVGYRAQAKDNVLTLSLGYSHPIDYVLPEGIQVETPNNTTVLLKGMDKQKVGQIASEIRGYRPPEPYKGKGIRYLGEQVARKEAKKK
jgi:large subunit ribosomal protein L6